MNPKFYSQQTYKYQAHKLKQHAAAAQIILMQAKQKQPDCVYTQAIKSRFARKSTWLFKKVRTKDIERIEPY